MRDRSLLKIHIMSRMVMGLCINGDRKKSGLEFLIISRSHHRWIMMMKDPLQGNNVCLFRMPGRSHSATIAGKKLPMEQISALFVGLNFIVLVDLPDPGKKAGLE